MHWLLDISSDVILHLLKKFAKLSRRLTTVDDCLWKSALFE